MAKFSKHVPVHDGFNTVWFAPGDEVPEWAADKVGDHVIISTASKSTKETTQDAEPKVDEKAESQDGPDFTKPAEPKRRNTRKKA